MRKWASCRFIMKGVGAYGQCALDWILINVAVNSDMLIYFARVNIGVTGFDIHICFMLEWFSGYGSLY